MSQEHALCGSCQAVNSIPVGAPSFNCYKCGRTSTKPGLQQQPSQYQQAAPQQQTVVPQPPQTVIQQAPPVVQQTTVVQAPPTIVTAPVVGQRMAYGAYGGVYGGSGAGSFAAVIVFHSLIFVFFSYFLLCCFVGHDNGRND